MIWCHSAAAAAGGGGGQFLLDASLLNQLQRVQNAAARFY